MENAWEGLGLESALQAFYASIVLLLESLMTLLRIVPAKLGMLHFVTAHRSDTPVLRLQPIGQRVAVTGAIYKQCQHQVLHRRSDERADDGCANSDGGREACMHRRVRGTSTAICS